MDLGIHPQSRTLRRAALAFPLSTPPPLNAQLSSRRTGGEALPLRTTVAYRRTMNIGIAGLGAVLATLLTSASQRAPVPPNSVQATASPTAVPSAKSSLAGPRPVSIPAAAPPSIDGGCPDQRDLRTSDLCAQWKAADAARDAANWAERTFWGGLLSLGILVITLWQTRAAVAETRRIGQEQTRAYLAVSEARSELRIQEGLDLQAPRLTLTLSNSGDTPATNVSYYCGASVIEVGEQALFRCPEKLPYLTVAPNVAADSAITIETGAHGIFPKMQDADALQDKVTEDTPFGKMPCIAIWGTVLYDDVFGATFRSDFAYLLEDHHREGRRILRLVQAGFPKFGEDGRPILSSFRPRTYQPVRVRRL